MPADAATTPGTGLEAREAAELLTLLDNYEVVYVRHLIEEDREDLNAMAWPFFRSLHDGGGFDDSLLWTLFQEKRQEQDFTDLLELHCLMNTERPVNTMYVLKERTPDGRMRFLQHPDTNVTIEWTYNYAFITDHGGLKAWVDSIQWLLTFPLIDTPTRSGEKFWLHQDRVFRRPGGGRGLAVGRRRNQAGGVAL